MQLFRRGCSDLGNCLHIVLLSSVVETNHRIYTLSYSGFRPASNLAHLLSTFFLSNATSSKFAIITAALAVMVKLFVNLPHGTKPSSTVGVLPAKRKFSDGLHSLFCFFFSEKKTTQITTVQPECSSTKMPAEVMVPSDLDSSLMEKIFSKLLFLL